MAGAGVFEIELNEDEVEQDRHSEYSDEEPINAKEDGVKVSLKFIVTNRLCIKQLNKFAYTRTFKVFEESGPDAYLQFVSKIFFNISNTSFIILQIWGVGDLRVNRDDGQQK